MGKRHTQLLQLIDLFQPKSIIEIGTWNGWNAVNMIRAAQKHHPIIEYIGYDLFEDATPETDAAEFNVKEPKDAGWVERKIKSKCPDAKVTLIKGNTRDTLKSASADFAFIDGGHSVETIASDYLALRNSPVIVLDDYYSPDDMKRSPDIDLVGCNELVCGLSRFKLLPIKDPMKDGGWNQMVLVL
jgi:predicted O-methyltransferase YrrM